MCNPTLPELGTGSSPKGCQMPSASEVWNSVFLAYYLHTVVVWDLYGLTTWCNPYYDLAEKSFNAKTFFQAFWFSDECRKHIFKHSHVLETNLRHDFQTNLGLSVLENGDHFRQGLAPGQQKHRRIKKCQANIEAKSRLLNMAAIKNILRLCRHSISRKGCLILQPVFAKMILFIWNLEEPLGRPVGHSCWLHAVQIDIANHT